MNINMLTDHYIFFSIQLHVLGSCLWIKYCQPDIAKVTR